MASIEQTIRLLDARIHQLLARLARDRATEAMATGRIDRELDRILRQRGH